jgi:hypothetical protein
VTVATALAISPGGASADVTGNIDYAEATPDWTYGSFAGSITYTNCASRVQCDWTGIVTVQPTTYACDSNDPLPSGDRNVSLVAGTGTQSTDGTVMFSKQNWPIIRGVYGQRLCLYLWEQGTIHEPDPFCQIAPQFCDPGGVDRALYFFSTVAQRIFTVSSLSPPAPPAPPSVAPNTVRILPPLTRKVASSKAKRALARKYGRAYKRGKRKRLSCSRRSSLSYRCKFSFKYRRKRHSGHVVVVSTDTGIKTTVRARR